MTDGQGGSASHSGIALDDQQDAKRAMRKAVRLRRAALTAEWRARASQALTERFLADIPIPSGARVAGFVPVGDEVDVFVLMGALARTGHSCCLPVIDGPAQPLVFKSWQPGEPLVDGPHGIPQPPADAAEATPDLVLAPLLAFDRLGDRLGYGKGYYDRTLAALKDRAHVLAIGVAFSVQEEARVPAGIRDIPLDGVVTERETLFPISG